MVVFNSSVNFYVYWLKNRLMKNNLIRINTAYYNGKCLEKKNQTACESEMETKFECSPLVKTGDM